MATVFVFFCEYIHLFCFWKINVISCLSFIIFYILATSMRSEIRDFHIYSAFWCKSLTSTEWVIWLGRAIRRWYLPKGPYPPCLRMAERALLAGYPRRMCIVIYATFSYTTTAAKKDSLDAKAFIDNLISLASTPCRCIGDILDVPYNWLTEYMYVYVWIYG